MTPYITLVCIYLVKKNHLKMIEEDHNVIRDYLLQFDGGKIELNKDLNTGVAYICLNHPERKNAISGISLESVF